MRRIQLVLAVAAACTLCLGSTSAQATPSRSGSTMSRLSSPQPYSSVARPRVTPASTKPIASTTKPGSAFAGIKAKFAKATKPIANGLGRISKALGTENEKLGMLGIATMAGGGLLLQHAPSLPAKLGGAALFAVGATALWDSLKTPAEK